MNKTRAIAKLTAFALWSLLLVPAQILVLSVHRGPKAYLVPNLWHKGVCRILGLTLRIEGAPETEKQVLFVCNHLSYLDIPVIGALLHASFIAKKEVSGWPLFGFLSKMQQTAFIDRSRHAVAKESQSLSSMLGAGKSLILFPEGTSSDGSSVLPFKSSFFSIAMENGVADSLLVQPVTVFLETIEGQTPLTQKQRDLYAWHGDMDLAPHLWAFACSRGASLTLKFHPAHPASSFADRKALASASHESVTRGLQEGANKNLTSSLRNPEKL